MSEVITKLKVKQLDGNFGQEIPVGAKAQNVYFDQKLSTETNNILGRVNASLSLDTLTKNLQDKLITFQEKKGSNSAISDDVWSSALDSNKILVTNENGEIAASSIAATSLSAINTIGDKQNTNLGSGNANKVLVTNGSSNITVSNNTTVNDLEKIAGIGGTNGISGTLLQTLNDKQPKIGDNSALIGSGTNIWTNKLASKNKVLISDANGTITTSDITTNQLNSLANLNTLLGQKADTATTNNALNNTITVNQTTGTEVKLDFNTLGGTTVPKSITAASSSQNGIMTKAQYDDLYSLRNLHNRTVANNLTTGTAGTAVLDAYQGYLLDRDCFHYRGLKEVASEFVDDTYITSFLPGAYEIFFKVGNNGNTTEGINQVVPSILPSAMGSLLVFWDNKIGAYKSFIFMSNSGGRIYIRHASGSAWHYGWTQINPTPANNLTSTSTTVPLAANQGRILNLKGTGGGSNNAYKIFPSSGDLYTINFNIASDAISSDKYYKIVGGVPAETSTRQSIPLAQGTWLVYCNFKNAGTKTFQVDLAKTNTDSPGYNLTRVYEKSTVQWTALMTMTIPSKTDGIEGRAQMMVPITISASDVTSHNNELSLWAHFGSAGSSGAITVGIYAIKLI